MTQYSHTDLGLYRRLLVQARAYWPHIVGIFLLGLLSTPLVLLTPVPLKIAVDSVIGSHPLPGFLEALIPGAVPRSDTAVLTMAAALLVAIALLSQIQSMASSVLSTYTGEKLIREFRVRLFGHVQRLSVSYHDAKGTSEATYRIQYDVEAIQSIVMKSFPSLIVAGCTLVFMVYIMLRLDWQLALVALLIFPVLLTLSHVYRGSLRRQAREVKQLESSALSVIQEVLGALRVVKAFGQEDREKERFARSSGEGLRARLRLAVAEGGLGVLIGLITAAGTATVLFLGVRHVQSGQLTLGELLLVMAYLAQLYSPLKTISKQFAKLQSSLASAERAYELLDRVPEVVERPHAQPLERASGTIELRDVSFAYDGEHLVLQDVSLDIPAGTRVGIAGRTGAGKTTLLHLLPRFHDPTAGRILLDGVDLRDYKLDDLRNQFAIVLQEPVLFSASIAENISYALPGADFEHIVAAAKAANAHEFILALPDGYNTMVGERGMRLSGGERQRIALARAFLKDAPILLLDEPTSSVDVKTEAAIMEAMERLMEGRTTLLVTHRRGTLEICDMKIELQHGCALSAVGV